LDHCSRTELEALYAEKRAQSQTEQTEQTEPTEQTGKVETPNLSENLSHAPDHPNLSGLSAPPVQASAGDPWADLDIPSYLRRERLGPPAISSGPDDDLGDFQ
jgi:hypothetical protein